MIIRNMIKAFACKIACPIQSQSWIALSSLEQWQSSMSGNAMMRMMIIDDEIDGDDENADDSMHDADNNHHNHSTFSTRCIQEPLADTLHSRCLFEHHNAYHIYIPGFQDPARSSPLTHLARYSAEVPNSASASTWLQPPQITH